MALGLVHARTESDQRGRVCFSSAGTLGGPAPAQMPGAKSRSPLNSLIPKGFQDSPGASPRTRGQNMQPGSRDRDREAQSGLTWRNGPHQGWTGWASLQRWPQAPFWTSFPCPTPVLMGTHLASHQEPLSLGPQLMRPHLRSTLHSLVLSPRTGCPSSLWPWCGQASELQC